MADRLARFLDGDIDGASFRHADHVRAGFEILETRGFPEAAVAFSRSLKIIAARAGNAGAYHETITLAFLSLIAERRLKGAYADFDAFARDNTDLLDKSVLKRWYTPQRLASDAARRTFLLPEASHRAALRDRGDERGDGEYGERQAKHFYPLR